MQAPLTALVFGGGTAPTEHDQARLPEATLVIAADSGTDHALACGRSVDVVVGDLDSVSPNSLAVAEASGAVIERYPASKDASDLELAMCRAAAEQPSKITVTAISGGRIDHLLANLALVSSSQFSTIEVDIVSGGDRMAIVRSKRTLDLAVGQIVTLIPMHGPAHGVVTSGLAYPLLNETLEAGSTRGLSNVVAAPAVTIEVSSGVLLVLVPNEPEVTT